MAESTRRAWHRLFGIGLADLFVGSGWRVELEKELALRSQLLDVVIIECDAAASGPPAGLPDGLEGLRPHNLLTYKSQHEALDGWALEELVGHYVNYRKLERTRRRGPGAGAGGAAPGPKDPPLLPEGDFRLYAVATRMPQGLCRRAVCRATAWQGVFDLRWGLRDIRLIVLDGIAEHPRNAPWELFSADLERIRHGARHYDPHSPEAEALLYELYLRYKLELPNMTYTLADFARESREHLLADLTHEERLRMLDELPPEEVIRRLSTEERLRGLPPEERLRGLPPEERLRGLPPEERLRGLPPEERLRGLSPEERRALRQLLDRDDDQSGDPALRPDPKPCGK